VRTIESPPGIDESRGRTVRAWLDASDRRTDRWRRDADRRRESRLLSSWKRADQTNGVG